MCFLSEAEKRTLTAVSGHTLTLDSALEYSHDFAEDTVEGHTYTRTAEVGLLTRLITIEGDDTDDGEGIIFVTVLSLAINEADITLNI